MESQPDFLRAFSGLTVREATALGNKMGYKVIVSHALPEMGRVDSPAKGEIGLWMGEKGLRVERALLGLAEQPMRVDRPEAPKSFLLSYCPSLSHFKGLSADEAIALGRRSGLRVIVAKSSPDARQVTLPKHAEIGLWLDSKGRVEHAEHSAADRPSPLELAMSSPVPPVLPYGHPYFTTATSRPLFLPSTPTRLGYSAMPPPNPYRSWSAQPPPDKKPYYGGRCVKCQTPVNGNPLAGETHTICINCNGIFCNKCTPAHYGSICKGKKVTTMPPNGG